jgi:hypothetical protein
LKRRNGSLRQAPPLDLETITSFTPTPMPTKEDFMRKLTLEELRDAVAEKNYFAAGDISLGLVPLQPRGPRKLDHVNAALAEMSTVSGASKQQLAVYRYVASRWQPDQRRADVSWAVHHALAPHPERAQLIKSRPTWTVRAANEARGRALKPQRRAGDLTISNLSEVPLSSHPQDSPSAASVDADVSSDRLSSTGVVVIAADEETGARIEPAASPWRQLEEVNGRLAEAITAMNRLAFELGRRWKEVA